MLQLQPLPAFEDNYIWALSGPDGRAVIVDPGDAAPVFAAAQRGLEPVAILLTHHHADHIGGAAALAQHWSLPCYGPDDERIDDDIRVVRDGDRVTIGELGIQFDVLEVPGHTRSHIAFFGAGHLFCGDTLFSLGCGRRFEGTPEQMLASLDRLAALPAGTLVCCGHEYTLANAHFAMQVEPQNDILRARFETTQTLRREEKPTVPSTLGSELAANPFLRTQVPEVIASATQQLGRAPRDRVETFAALRRWKDGFRAA